jgi:hypothetical protein
MSRKINYLFPVLLLVLYGCGNYYMVRDPATDATYYTTDVDRTGESGAVKFKDRGTGSVVTIQQSEVRKISEDEYEAAIKRGK